MPLGSRKAQSSGMPAPDRLNIMSIRILAGFGQSDYRPLLSERTAPRGFVVDAYDTFSVWNGCRLTDAETFRIFVSPIWIGSVSARQILLGPAPQTRFIPIPRASPPPRR